MGCGELNQQEHPRVRASDLSRSVGPLECWSVRNIGRSVRCVGVFVCRSMWWATKLPWSDARAVLRAKRETEPKMHGTTALHTHPHFRSLVRALTLDVNPSPRANTGSYGEFCESCQRKAKVANEKFVLERILRWKKFGARQFIVGSEKFFFMGLVGGGGVLLFFLLTNGEKQTDPFIPHGEPGRSVLQKHGKLAGGIKSGVLSLNRS